jgi:hypothetical protein
MKKENPEIKNRNALIGFRWDMVWSVSCLWLVKNQLLLIDWDLTIWYKLRHLN